jgi:hypothetical protein
VLLACIEEGLEVHVPARAVLETALLQWRVAMTLSHAP